MRELIIHLCNTAAVTNLSNPSALAAETKDTDADPVVETRQQTHVTRDWLDYFVFIDLTTGEMLTKAEIDWQGLAKAWVCLSDAWVTDMLPQLAIKLGKDSAQSYASRVFAETALTGSDNVLFFLQDSNGHYPVQAKPVCRIATAHKIFKMQSSGLVSTHHYYQNEGGKKAMPHSAQAWRLIKSLGMRFLQNLGRSDIYKRRAKGAAWAAVICWAEYGKNSKWGSMSKYNALVLLFTELFGVGIAVARSAVMAVSDLDLPGFHFDKAIEQACKMQGLPVPQSCYGWKTHLALTVASGAGQYVLVQSMRKDAPYKDWLSGVSNESLHFWGATAITYLGGVAPSLFTGLLLWGIARELTTVVTGVVHATPDRPGLGGSLQVHDYALLPGRAPVPPGVAGFIFVVDDQAAPPIGVVMTHMGGSPRRGGVSPSIAIPVGDMTGRESRTTSAADSSMPSSLNTTTGFWPQ